ncbi:uncharacterized protein si:ch211-12e13.10 [Megalobrama amblycephala]|uniref:uncharacterized protein si:ch211-12e13.10 n=1 Tax=Megalobrama amblycephala TaxID=75352 RepID=UPI0020143B88|nr:uncharacterized protein si:ch211-12e13.10 [Megalobrama amblycephala]
MKNLIIFVGLLSITLGFSVGSPLHKRERRRRQLGFGYGHGPVYPFYDPFLHPDRHNDFTPEIYIRDHARPSVPKPVTIKPQRPTTSVVQPVTFGDLCPPARGDDLNIDQLPVFFYADPKEWSSMGADRPLSPGQSGSNNLQPAFIIVPGVFLPTSEDSRVTQNTNGLKAPDPLSITQSNIKQKDC